MADAIEPVYDNEPLPVYDNETRPDPSKVKVGLVIWNTDDNAPNVSDGEYWRDIIGNIT